MITFLRSRSHCENGDEKEDSVNHLHFWEEKNFWVALWVAFGREYRVNLTTLFLFTNTSELFSRIERKLCICLCGSCMFSNARRRSDQNIRRPNTDTHTHAYDATQRNKQTNMHSGQRRTLKASKYPRQLIQFHQKQRLSDIGSCSTCLKMM